MKHTPGPWRIAEVNWQEDKLTILGDKQGVSSIVVCDTAVAFGKGKGIQAANARLIVQAPEMYRRLTEAAQFLNGEYPNSRENRDYLKISIEAVLAKVERGE